MVHGMPSCWAWWGSRESLLGRVAQHPSQHRCVAQGKRNGEMCYIKINRTAIMLAKKTNNLGLLPQGLLLLQRSTKRISTQHIPKYIPRLLTGKRLLTFPINNPEIDYAVENVRAGERSFLIWVKGWIEIVLLKIHSLIYVANIMLMAYKEQKAETMIQ